MAENKGKMEHTRAKGEATLAKEFMFSGRSNKPKTQQLSVNTAKFSFLFNHSNSKNFSHSILSNTPISEKGGNNNNNTCNNQNRQFCQGENKKLII